MKKPLLSPLHFAFSFYDGLTGCLDVLSNWMTLSNDLSLHLARCCFGGGGESSVAGGNNERSVIEELERRQMQRSIVEDVEEERRRRIAEVKE